MASSHLGAGVAEPVLRGLGEKDGDGGPLGLVEDGDRIRMSVADRRLDLVVDDAELARRQAAKTEDAVMEHRRGYGKLFVDHVLQADQGCDFDFLRGTDA